MHRHSASDECLAEILKVLPHRYPFLFVDRVLELEAGHRVTGIKQVSTTDLRDGRFPEVLILEMMAQVGAVLLLAGEGATGRIPYFAGIERAQFCGVPVMAGDTLVATLTVRRMRGPLGWAEGQVRIGDQIVCEARLSYALGE